MEYMKTSTYLKMWRAQDKVRDWYLGGQQESFHKIPVLMERLQEVDPRAVVDWDTLHVDRTFKKAFVFPSTM